MRRALKKGSSLPMTRARLPLRPALVNQWAHLGLNQAEPRPTPRLLRTTQAAWNWEEGACEVTLVD